MSKYKVGDNVWYAKYRQEKVRELCDTCYGKRVVTLILGNGDEVVLDCGACTSGYAPPTGYQTHYRFVSEPELVIISGMEVNINGDREETRYKQYALGGGYYSYDEIDLFVDKESAQARSDEKRLEAEIDQATRAEGIKKNVHKSFSWNAHYYMSTAKRLRKDAEYHDKKAVICKSRSKEESGK